MCAQKRVCAQILQLRVSNVLKGESPRRARIKKLLSDVEGFVKCWYVIVFFGFRIYRAVFFRPHPGAGSERKEKSQKKRTQDRKI
mmetsp:Transcript_104954/g.169031  ORF Transcript_104954/g.169031 Transcript_104954/m.169031 type:complete len:85 (-) Transcript_104954:81-335(-)